VKVAMVSRHVPDPAGTAAGRALFALGEGLVDAGHDLDVWSWWYDAPVAALPAWCRWEPLPDEPRLRTRLRALIRPRSDVVRAGWTPPADADVVVADDPVSFPAVDGHPRSILTVHYSTVLDAAALGDRSPRAWQDQRAERRFARHAAGVVAYSARVAAALPASAVTTSIGCPVPAAALALVDEPVAACVADWRWPANARAAATLLAAWPAVRAEIPPARLVLAGTGSEGFDQPAQGIAGLGRVADAQEVLAAAAVLAFPCPATSGPKVKVLEAMASGLPVVTTQAGAEGVGSLDEGDPLPVTLAPVDPGGFADAIVRLLRDPSGRAEQATAARRVIEDHHAPSAVAEHRMRAWEAALEAVSGGRRRGG
jgi:glycosyltransferase involved in cell wall biosynthesis